MICVTLTLTSFAEIPLDVMALSREQVYKKKTAVALKHLNNHFTLNLSRQIKLKRRKSSVYSKFPGDEEGIESHRMKDMNTSNERRDPTYGATKTTPPGAAGASAAAEGDEKTQHVANNPFAKVVVLLEGKEKNRENKL